MISLMIFYFKIFFKFKFLIGLKISLKFIGTQTGASNCCHDATTFSHYAAAPWLRMLTAAISLWHYLSRPLSVAAHPKPAHTVSSSLYYYCHYSSLSGDDCD